MGKLGSKIWTPSRHPYYVTVQKNKRDSPKCSNHLIRTPPTTTTTDAHIQLELQSLAEKRERMRAREKKELAYRMYRSGHWFFRLSRVRRRVFWRRFLRRRSIQYLSRRFRSIARRLGVVSHAPTEGHVPTFNDSGTLISVLINEFSDLRWLKSVTSPTKSVFVFQSSWSRRPGSHYHAENHGKYHEKISKRTMSSWIWRTYDVMIRERTWRDWIGFDRGRLLCCVDKRLSDRCWEGKRF